MAGGTPDHAALAGAVIGLLRAGIPTSCRTFTSDLRVRTPSGLSTYPDVAVICGKTSRAVDDAIAVTNPSILVEVTSNSTEDYDRGEKLKHYKSLSSVQEILIVSHREPRVTIHRRESDAHWAVGESKSGESVRLASASVTLAIDDIYRGGLEDIG